MELREQGWRARVEPDADAVCNGRRFTGRGRLGKWGWGNRRTGRNVRGPDFRIPSAMG